MVKLIGVVLVVIAVICIYVGRSNYNSLQSLKSEIDKYKSDNPVSTFFFGVTLTDKAQQEATSASKFAYSFTPPLTPKELLVYLGLAVGIVMVIWGQGLGENQKSTQEFTPPVQTAPASPSYFGIITWIEILLLIFALMLGVAGFTDVTREAFFSGMVKMGIAGLIFKVIAVRWKM